MGNVRIGFSMSLDGFVAGPHDEIDEVFKWYFTGDTNYEVPSGDETLKMTKDGAERIEEAAQTSGVLVTARRTFDIANAWGGKHPMNVPMVVLTHRVPQEWVKEGSPFTFVTDGVESAIEKAKQIAGDKFVAIGAPSVAQQALKAGLVDEIEIDLAPVLLGEGVRLFDHLGPNPIELVYTSVNPASNVIHLLFRVVK
jgi:dihydrofolate reductase